MKRVGREGTAPEMRVRRHLHKRGLRYSLHTPGLPGRPDIVMTRRRTVVFVHGCFWHGHACRHGRVSPRTNADYWTAKIADNRARDARQQRELRELGWRVEVIWECECAIEHKLSKLAGRLLER